VPLRPRARVLDQVPQREGSPFVFHSPRGQPLIKGSHGLVMAEGEGGCSGGLPLA
jgi:hypothetical protein